MSTTQSFFDGLISVVHESPTDSARALSALRLLADEVESAPAERSTSPALRALQLKLEGLLPHGSYDAARILRWVTPRSHLLWLSLFRWRVGRAASSTDLIALHPPDLSLLLEILETLAAQEAANPGLDLAYGGARLMMYTYLLELCQTLSRRAEEQALVPADVATRIYSHVIDGLNGKAGAYRSYLDGAYCAMLNCLDAQQRAAVRKLCLVIRVNPSHAGFKWSEYLQGFV